MKILPFLLARACAGISLLCIATASDATAGIIPVADIRLLMPARGTVSTAPAYLQL